MATRNMLYKRSYEVNQNIKVVIPTVGQVLADEDGYYGLVSMFTAVPVDMMVQLDEVGVDFTTINDYELFLLLFPAIQQMDTSLVLGDLDLSSFRITVSEVNQMPIIEDPDTGVIIDRGIHGHIASALRKIHHMEKNRRKPGNDEAKAFMLERAKKKAKRRASTKQDSMLEEQIVALVCTEQYKYDFERTLELTIYQFQESLHQIIKKIDYDNRMYGVYAGTVSAKNLSEYEMNWLTHTKK